FFRRKQGSGAAALELGDFSADEKRQLDLVAYGTRPEQLFLNEGLRRGVAGFAPIGAWLRERLQLILPGPKLVGLASRAARGPPFLAFLGELLAESDTGLAQVDVRREAVGPEAFENEAEERELLAALTRFPDAFAETPDGELYAEKSGNLADLFRV